MRSVTQDFLISHNIIPSLPCSFPPPTHPTPAVALLHSILPFRHPSTLEHSFVSLSSTNGRVAAYGCCC